MKHWRRSRCLPVNASSTTVVDDLGVKDDFSYFKSNDYDPAIAEQKVAGLRYQLLKEHESVMDRFQLIRSVFGVNLTWLRRFAEGFEDDLTRGLQSHDAHPSSWRPSLSSFKMLDTYMSRTWTGLEKGISYGVHFSETKIRVTRLRIANCSEAPEVRTREFNWDGDSTAGKNLEFFEAIQQGLRTVMDLTGDLSVEEPLPLAVSFTLPVLQQSTEVAYLVSLSEKVEICRTLQNILDRTRTPLKVVAYTNEIVALYFAAAEESKRCGGSEVVMAIGAGQGVNVCYIEPHARSQRGYEGRMINVECGYMNRDLPLNVVDYELDFANTATQGHLLLEKMVGLPHLAELARRSLIRIFQDGMPSRAWSAGSFTDDAFLKIVADASFSKDITKIAILEIWDHLPIISTQLLQTDQDNKSTKISECEMISAVCQCILNRAAALIAGDYIHTLSDSGSSWQLARRQVA